VARRAPHGRGTKTVHNVETRPRGALRAGLQIVPIFQNERTVYSKSEPNATHARSPFNQEIATMQPCHQPTKTERLALAILRDRNNKQQPSSSLAPCCLTCGRTFARGAARFCSANCREAFDAGFPPCQPLDIKYSLPKGSTGFLIDCAHCRKRFDSPGWRCCSAACAREYRRKRALDAELDGDPFRAVKRKCLVCAGDIPNWRRGRRVSKAAKFCSSRCKHRHAQNAGKVSASPQAVLRRETAKKPPSNGLRRKGDAAPSPSAEAAP
jgi:hypothetical protein